MPHITPQMQGSIAAASRGSTPTEARVEINTEPKIPSVQIVNVLQKLLLQVTQDFVSTIPITVLNAERI